MIRRWWGQMKMRGDGEMIGWRWRMRWGDKAWGVEIFGRTCGDVLATRSPRRGSVLSSRKFETGTQAYHSHMLPPRTHHTVWSKQSASGNDNSHSDKRPAWLCVFAAKVNCVSVVAIAVTKLGFLGPSLTNYASFVIRRSSSFQWYPLWLESINFLLGPRGLGICAYTFLFSFTYWFQIYITCLYLIWSSGPKGSARSPDLAESGTIRFTVLELVRVQIFVGLACMVFL